MQCWLLFPKFCESLSVKGEIREKMIQRGETLKQKLEANSTRTGIERFTEKQTLTNLASWAMRPNWANLVKVIFVTIYIVYFNLISMTLIRVLSHP